MIFPGASSVVHLLPDSNGLPLAVGISAPPERTMVLDGSMSRWVRSARCAAAKASVTHAAVHRAFGRGRRRPHPDTHIAVYAAGVSSARPKSRA
ncbi:hypothetical protein GKJPGBOP_02216 [Streptomyces paromomycinus]|uniref:Uncharacterized protein n=1 Tax=Streptomyces paromomycinus TaxID=92743 RepID=A0A401VZT8_STREY|nr:hypothetical protein GKJPGBOP_02216 [Streptomyces paromomycinus]